MKHKGYDDQGRDIWVVHQSWLKDFLLCPERARQKMLGLVDDPGSDATAIGTAVHHHIEQRLLGIGTDHPTYATAYEMFDSLMATPNGPTWKQIKTAPTAHVRISNCIEAFERHVLPTIGDVQAVEWPFRILVHETDSYTLSIGGTVDCIADGAVFDWKTGKQYWKDRGKPFEPYDTNEHQRWAIQPTVYLPAVRTEFDVDEFIFVVLNKEAVTEPQFVPVTRSDEHAAWMVQQIESIVPTVQANLPVWGKNDQHYLCSEMWCPSWAGCKGKAMG